MVRRDQLKGHACAAFGKEAHMLSGPVRCQAKVVPGGQLPLQVLLGSQGTRLVAGIDNVAPAVRLGRQYIL